MLPRRRGSFRRAFLGAVTLLIAVGTGACADNDEGTFTRELTEAREAFVAGDYERARDLFRSIEPRASDAHAVALGVARSHQQLHEYGAALPRYERALELDPDDDLTWEGYVETLYRDGVLRGDAERLEAVLDVGTRALRAAPEAIEIYTHLLRAAAELGRADEYAPLLERVGADLPDNPVVRVELAKARIDGARRARNAALASAQPAAAEARAAEVEALEAELRAELEEASARVSSGIDADPGSYYLLAAGHDLLGESAPAEQALRQLERSDLGRDMAAPLRYEQFLGEWVRSVAADIDARVEIAERWSQRFAPRWSNDGERYRAILGMHLDAMVAAARADMAAGQGAPSEEAAERIARVGRRLARIDSGQAASRYVQTAGVLALVPSHYVTAVRIADDGIEALREERAGLLHPGTQREDENRQRRRYLSLLLQLQGQALHNLGRDEAAEAVLREAIDERPVAASYAALGGLLLDQGRAGEALDMFVAALAHGFDPGDGALEEQTRASALEAARRSGTSAAVVDDAVAAAADRVAAERDREIVAGALDLPAPDFELDDTKGDSWRLSALAGKVVVLNYWATWCGPCVAEMPYYQRLVDEYADATDVVFLAISTDSDHSVVAPFLEQNGYVFTVLYDRESAQAFRIRGVPASFVIGKDGLVKYRTSGFPGPDRYLREMRLRIEALRREGR